jgi:hypothetical protein
MYESGPAVMEVNKLKNELEKIKKWSQSNVICQFIQVSAYCYITDLTIV